MRRNPNHGFDR